MTAVIVRIALRYIAAALVTKGLLGADDAATFATDPDIQMALGAAIGAATEGWFYLAHKYGWAK